MNKSSNIGTQILDAVTSLVTVDNIQKYVLGEKKNGKPRAIYDIVKEGDKKKRKKKKRDIDTAYSLYRSTKKKKKKGKKSGKQSKYWKFD